MKLDIRSAMIIPLIFLLSCAKPTVEFTNVKDEIAQIDRYWLKGNIVNESEENSNSKWIALELLAEKKMKEEFKYFLFVRNAADGHKTIWINTGDSLIFNIDNTPYTLQTPNSPKQYTSPLYWYTETAEYEITKELIEKLINGKQIKFRVYGHRGNVGGEFGDTQKERFKQFMNNLPK